jgi:integrating conjugative element protein (TIGR03756 family)
MKTLKQRGLALLLSASMIAPSGAVVTAEIIPSALSIPCVQYHVDGICIWMTCTMFGCTTSTSMKVSHFNPETVVSSYGLTGANPWREVMFYSTPNPSADGMGFLSGLAARNTKRNNLIKFKNVDVIGHPGSIGDLNFGYTCEKATTSFTPYFISTLDSTAWRWGTTEQMYPETFIPGAREMAPFFTGNDWGNIFPRQGFLAQPDDYKAAAVMAQRAANITSSIGSPHLYQPTLGAPRQGYWPPVTPVLEMDPLNHHWQGLHPYVEPACYIFPTLPSMYADEMHDYAWALWRPYSCCEQAGQRLIYFSPSPYH